VLLITFEIMNIESPGISKEDLAKIYSEIVDLSPMPMYVCAGEDMTVIVANQATLKAWGKDRSVIGKKFKDALPEMDEQPFLQLLTQVYQTGQIYQTDHDRAEFLIDGKMETFYFKFSYQPLRDHNGNIWAVLCIATDVTELVLANMRAEESERRFKDLILKAPIAICVAMGPTHIVEVANEKILELWGVSEEQVINKPIFEGIPEATGQGLEQLLDEVYRTGNSYTGEEVPVELPSEGGVKLKFLNFIYQPYYEIDGRITGVMASAIDVTELVNGRRRIEAAHVQLAKTQQRLEVALQVGRLGAYERNITRGEMIASKQFRKNIGFDEQAPIAVSDILKEVLPSYRQELEKLQTEASSQEGFIYNVEFPLQWPDGSIHWLRIAGRSLRDENGDMILAGVSQDITEEKNVQQQKDDFISIASHELKTPITSLKASLQILNRIKNEPDSPMLPKLIEQANASLTKVSRLIDDLLNATKMKEGQLPLNKTRFKLSTLANECCEHVRDTHYLNVTGELGLEVFADQHRIEQVIVNLVNNAVKYAPDSKRIDVHIESADQHALVTVRDHGEGIPKEKLEDLFDRFFRVDQQGKTYPGLGLGLYIAAEIIQRHGGKIGVESELGKGSSFWFTIPR
jgi:PAS domain S-box-containing protein